MPLVYTILIKSKKRKLKILVSWAMGNGCTRTWYLEKAFCNDCSRNKIDAIWVLDLGYVCNTHMNMHFESPSKYDLQPKHDNFFLHVIRPNINGGQKSF